MGSSTCHYTKLNFCLKIKDQIICDYSHDILTSKQDPSLIDNNDNKLLKINISDPAITIINDESDYKIVILQNKQKNILNALYNIFNKNNDVSDKNEVIVSYINGEKYIGEWASIKNQKEGRGIKMFKNNYIYYGYWENDKMNGEGKLIKFKQKINDINIIFNDNTTPFYYGTWKNNFQDGLVIFGDVNVSLIIYIYKYSQIQGLILCFLQRRVILLKIMQKFVMIKP